MSFGYRGDKTGDSLSIQGIGAFAFDDPERGGTPMVPLQDAALKASDAELIYHVNPGEMFVSQDPETKGQTFRYADHIPEWSPARAGYVDVFDPGHAPDSAGSAGSNVSLRSGYDYTSTPDEPLTGAEDAEIEELEKEDPRKQSEKPTDVLGPDFMLQQIRQQFPQYGHYNNDEILKALEEKHPTPIAQLLAIFPQYKDVPTPDLMEGLRRKFYPDLSPGEFKDLANPPTGIDGIYKNFINQSSNFTKQWYASTAEIAKYPDRAIDLLNKVVKALNIKADAPVATIKNAPDRPDIRVEPAPPPVPSKLHPDIVGPLYKWGLEQGAKGEKITPVQPVGVSGIVGKKIFGLAGQTPYAAASFVPGLRPAQALVWGMQFEAVQAASRAKEQGQDNLMAHGAEGLTYRNIQQWLLSTPRGRALSALLWGAAGTVDKVAQDFMDGRPSNLTDLVDTAATNAIIGGIASTEGSDPKFKFAPPIKQAFSEALALRDAGLYLEAGKAADRTMLLLSDTDRKAAANNLLTWRNEAFPADRGEAPAEQRSSRKMLLGRQERIDIPSGKPIATPYERSGPVIARPYRTKEVFKPLPYDPSAPGPSASVMTPEPGSVLSRTEPLRIEDRGPEPETEPPEPESEPETPFNAINDNFYFGFAAAPKMVSEILEAVAPKLRTLEKIPVFRLAYDFFNPETVNEERQLAASQIGKEIAAAQVDRQRFAQVWWRKQKLDDDLRFAYEADQRRAFWYQFNHAQRKKMLENWESKISTGNKTADRILVYYDHLYAALARFDKRYNLNYNVRDSYIPHILKDPNKIGELESLIRRMNWGDPRFMKARQFDNLRALHTFGFELKTYNPEELFQLRLDSSLYARQQGRTLENLADAGLAVTSEDMQKFPEDIQEQLKTQMAPEVRRSPMSDVHGHHRTYWVHKEAEVMMRQALDPLKLHPLAELGGNTLRTIKQRTVGINLGWSAFHHLHMLTIGAADNVGTVLGAALDRGATRESVANAILDAASFGAYGHVRNVPMHLPFTGIRKAGYGNRILQYYNAKLDLGDMSPGELKTLELHRRGGFTPYLSHEREIQVMQSMLGHISPAMRYADGALDLGYNVLAGAPYQRWLFGQAIPSMKMFSYDAQVESLTRTNPELLLPRYRFKFDQELRKIRNNVDRTFGEQNMGQNFSHKFMKGMGQNLLLSYGWLLSFIGTYGGGLHDLSKILTHYDEIAEIYRREGTLPAARRVLTNRAIKMLTLTAMTGAANGIMSATLGSGIDSMEDFFFPKVDRIFGKDREGNPRRVKPPFWITTELAGLANDIHEYDRMGPPFNLIMGTGKFFTNKMMPALAEIGYQINNKDYFGNAIVDAPDPKKSFAQNTVDQLTDRVKHFASNVYMPFSAQAIAQPGSDWKDHMFAMLGLPPASKRAMRTEAENSIIDAYVAGQGDRTKTHAAHRRSDARDELRLALQSGDQARIDAAKEKADQAGLSETAIKDVEDTLDQTTGQRLLKSINPEEQEFLLLRMNPEDRAKYLPYASPKVRDKFEDDSK